MSNPIARVDSRVIGEHEADGEGVTLQAAQNALVSAGLGKDLNLTRVKSRMTVGRFIAANMSGHIVAQGVWYQEMLEKAASKLEAQLDVCLTPVEIVAVAGAIKDVAGAAASMAAVQLKAVEIMAHGKKKKTKQGLAPQTIITGANPQIVVAGQPAGNGVASGDVSP